MYSFGVFFLSGYLMIFTENTLAEINQPPNFLPGGDMSRFSIREDTAKGSSVYTLRASDPEETKISYSIESRFLAVDNQSGVVTLISNLDRETQPFFEVTLTATDEEIFGLEPNSVSIKREITILDQNDNSPIFHSLPYLFYVKETTPVERIVYEDIFVSDSDSGINSEIVLSCDVDKTPESCSKFYIKTEKLPEGEGKYRGIIGLQESLDYEISSSYLIAIKAEDQSIGQRFATSAIIVAYVEDEQDQPPIFDKNPIRIDVAEESLTRDPVLSVKVYDGDRGNPRPLRFSIEDDLKEHFAIDKVVNDTSGIYVVTIATSGKPLDREESSIRLYGGIYIFTIKATELENDQLTDVSTILDVLVVIRDINDNVPQIIPDKLEINVREDVPLHLPIPGLDFRVEDLDAGENATFNFTLDASPEIKEMFQIIPQSAQMSAAVTFHIKNQSSLDYENPDLRIIQFKLIATDTNGLTSASNITIHLQDVNDNAPEFTSKNYTIEISSVQENGASLLELKAIDKDNGLLGEVNYKFLANPYPEYFELHKKTGAIFVADCNNPTCNIPKKDYCFLVEATDNGSLSDFADVTISVADNESGIESIASNPTTDHEDVLEETEILSFPQSVYNVSIRETTREGTAIARLTASSSIITSPVQYSILKGARENFMIDSTEAIMTVAPGAVLDVNLAGFKYIIKVQAHQKNGSEFLTARTDVHVEIEDINNKAPTFLKSVYIEHLEHDPNIGDTILLINASDPDTGAQLKYSLNKHADTWDRQGKNSSLKTNNYFTMDETSGQLTTIAALVPESVSMIQLQAIVEDTAAQTPNQVDTADILITFPSSRNYVSDWKLPPSKIEAEIPEEIEIGTVILNLKGEPSPEEGKIIIFEKSSDHDEYFYVNKDTGAVTVQKRLDYESLGNSKEIALQIIISTFDETLGNTTIIFNVTDLNDNFPVFDQTAYNFSVMESNDDTNELLMVHATDKDEYIDFRSITYHLLDKDAENFVIDQNTGRINKQNGVILDREKQASHYFKVLAKDNPKDEMNQRTATVDIFVQVLDANDNPPVFSQSSYFATVFENQPPHHNFLRVQATDEDIGLNSVVEYVIINSKEVPGLFDIDSKSGDLFVNQSLSTKGRKEPYSITVRARDRGEPSKFSDVEILIVIIRLDMEQETINFIHPQPGETLYISENTEADSSVYRAEISESNPVPNFDRRVHFSFLDRGYGGSLENVFRIDPDTGLISLRKPLDRENTEIYTLVVLAEKGNFLSTFCEFNVIVTDENDNKPYFSRPKNAEPLKLFVQEETDFGTVIGKIKALDPDSEENAIILYTILGKIQNNFPFAVNRTTSNEGLLYVVGRLDREHQSSYNFTIQTINPGTEIMEEMEYIDSDLSLLRIQVVITDIDDNPIQFKPINKLLGVRLSVPQQTMIVKLEAEDLDITDNPIHYSVRKVEFLKENSEESTPSDGAFSIDKETGILRTAQSLLSYEDGHFLVKVVAQSANNSGSQVEKQLKIRTLHEASMLKFIFQTSPPDLKMQIDKIHRDFQSALDSAQPQALKLTETQMIIGEDDGFDSQSASACFQLIRDSPLNLKQVQNYLNPSANEELKFFYRHYNITDISSCEPARIPYRTSWIEIMLITLIGVQSALIIIGTFLVCCLHRITRRSIQTKYSPQSQPPSECQSQMPSNHSSKVHFQSTGQHQTNSEH